MQTTSAPEHISSQGRALMTIREFCEWSRIGKTAAYREIKLGRLVLRKVGSKSLIAVADAEAWLQSLPTATV